VAELDPVVQKFVADMSAYGRNVEQGARQADHFGESNTAAALAARKMALSAKEAGEAAQRGMRDAATAAEEAAKAQEQAAEAAEKLARGELGADEAAQAQARAMQEAQRAADEQTRAMNGVERANIRAAEAAQANARAVDAQAEQYRQLARDAEVAAGVQQLSWLKANGTAEQHNQLLNKLRSDYGELGRDATSGMKEMENAEAQAAEAGSVMGPLIVAGLALVPPAATLVASAVTLGLGGALAGLGLKATYGSQSTQYALDELKSHVGSVMADISKPWDATWQALADSATKAFDGITPDLAAIFHDIAPEVSKFAETLGRQLPDDLHNLLDAVDRDFGPIADELGATLPDALKKVADGLAKVMDEAAQHPQIFGDLINGIATLISAIETIIVWLEKVMEFADMLGEKADEAAQGVTTLGNALTGMGGPLQYVGGLLREVGTVAQDFTSTYRSSVPDIRQFGETVADSAAQAAKAAQDNQDLADSASNAAMSLKDLSDALDAYLNPQIAAYQDTAKLKDKMVELSSALKASKTGLDDNTDAGRTAMEAFAKAITLTEDLGLQTEKATGSQQKAADAIRGYIAKLWEMAGASPAARQQVADLATLFGVQLPKSATTAKGKIDGVHDAMSALKSPPPINLRVNTAQALAAVNSVQAAINNLFGHASGALAQGGLAVGLASGGVGYYPDGGAVHGRGTSTSDEVNAHLSTGEFVVNAKSYAANAGLVNAINAAHGASIGSSGSSSTHLGSDPYKESVLTPSTPIKGGHVTLPKLAPPMPAAHRSYAETLNGSSGGSARPIVQNHNVYVAGSVWSEQELAEVIQRVFLTNGWTLTAPAGR
jgi:hypothetical protein